MRSGTLVLLVCVVAFATASSDSDVPLFLFGKPTRPIPEEETPADAKKPYEVFTVEQPIDHANPSLGTWKQQVQYNPTFYRGEELVFLMIGGESPATAKWVERTNITYLQWAQKYGAAVFQLEHRFFGNSRPYNNLKTESLKYCTVDQALKDLAAFIPMMNKKYGYNKPKWVTFGGSYPGALNAYFRAQYPDLTIGAVASSAPLTWEFDYWRYGQVMENAIRETSQECHTRVTASIKAIENKLFTVAGRTELSQKLRLKPAFNENTLTVHDLHNFMAYVFGYFQGVVQYTYDARDALTMGGLNLKNMCNAIVNEKSNDPLVQMRTLIDWIYTFYPKQDGSFPNNYANLINSLKNESFDGADAASRGWMWLCCNEIGVMQTTDMGRNMFGSMLPLNYFVDMCTDMFGPTVNIKSIRDNNLAYRKKYGDAEDYKGSNIVLPNGSLDPFHPIGTYVNRPEIHQTAMLIKGTAHCADMYPTWDQQPAALGPARATIEKELAYFIDSAKSSAALVPSTLLMGIAILLATFH